MSGDAIAASIAAALREAGTTVVFGVPGGGSNLDLVGACEQAGLRFVLTHGETAAALMAATYGELTGVPGACLATRGPGAASTVNGVAHARLDRCPLVAVTDVVPASSRPRITHQLLDQRALMEAAAKASCTLGADAADHARVAVSATTLAPWGPVHVDCDPTAASDLGRLPLPNRAAPDPAALTAARRLLGEARRPLLLAGVGARGGEAELSRFAADHGLPVLTTYKAKGAIDERRELAAGLLTGAEIESPILACADVILAVGLDPIELIPAAWPYPAAIVAIGPWHEPARYFSPTVELTGSVPELLAAVDGAMADGSGWGTSVAEYRAWTRACLSEPTGDDALSPVDVLMAAHEAFGPDATVTVDAGAHMLPAMELWSVSGPRRALISSGLATMGFALPGAIGAAVVDPDRPAVCVTGDGGLGMCLAELETVARLGLDLTVVVLDDACLSLIALKQRADQGGSAAVSYHEADFAAIARGVGLPAERVDHPEALRAALARAAAHKGPMLIDAIIDSSGYGRIMQAIRGGLDGRPERLLPA